MTKIYFIRHGETEWNTAGRYQGWTDIELSDKGEEQAARLGKRFEKMNVDAIYSSPLKRAYKTAQAIAEPKGIEIIKTDHFKEINFGDWEGFTTKELKETYGKEFIEFYNEPYKGKFPGEGSFELVTQRIKIGLEKILNESANKTIVIVSHGGLVRLAIMYLLDMEGSMYRKTWLDNTSISTVEINEGFNLLRTLNDVAHLDME